MTNVTPGAHIPFMEPTDPLKNVAAAIQGVAEAIYDVRDALSWVNQANWTVQSAYAQPVMGDAFFFLYLDFTYVGAAALTADVLTDTAPGNITDKPVAVLGQYRPAVEVNGIPTNRPGVNTWWSSLMPDGTFKLTNGPTGGKIPAGNVTPVPFKVRALIDRIG